MAERAHLASVPQTGMDEQVIEDADIEAALEERAKRKASLDAVRLTYDEAHDKAMAELQKLELPDGAVARVGRFRIERRHIAAGHREFDTKASSRLVISLPSDQL